MSGVSYSRYRISREIIQHPACEMATYERRAQARFTCRLTARTSIQSKKPSRNSKRICEKPQNEPFSGLWDTIGRLIDLFTPQEFANFFAAAGYDAT